MNNPQHVALIKRADLLSSIGAGVLGAGIALLLGEAIVRYAIPILLLGLIAHSTGMFQKHRLERQEDSTRIWWAETLYWLCWLALVALLIFIIIGQF